MPQPDDRFRMTVNLTLEREPRSGESSYTEMMTNDVRYSNLDYKDVVALESMMIDLLDDLNEIGKENVEQLQPGARREIDAVRDSVNSSRPARRLRDSVRDDRRDDRRR